MGHTVIALHTVIRYTRLFGWIWGRNGIWQSSDRIWACSRLSFCWKNGILDFWKPSDRIWACSRLLFFWKNSNLGFWKPIFGFWKPSESIGACSRLFFFLKMAILDTPFALGGTTGGNRGTVWVPSFEKQPTLTNCWSC